MVEISVVSVLARLRGSKVKELFSVALPWAASCAEEPLVDRGLEPPSSATIPRGVWERPWTVGGDYQIGLARAGGWLGRASLTPAPAEDASCPLVIVLRRCEKEGSSNGVAKDPKEKERVVDMRQRQANSNPLSSWVWRGIQCDSSWAGSIKL